MQFQKLFQSLNKSPFVYIAEETEQDKQTLKNQFNTTIPLKYGNLKTFAPPSLAAPINFGE